MKWHYVTYDPMSHVQRHVIHPLIAKSRMHYLTETYGVTPSVSEKSACVHMDQGGMITIDEPFITVDLAKDRQVSVLAFQALSIAEALRSAPIEKFGRYRAVRFPSFPGTLVFLSIPDRDKLVKALEISGGPDIAHQHALAVHAALGRANTRAFMHARNVN